MKIGISGASGQLGAATIAEVKARARSAEIVGISRSPDKLSALGIEGRFGDFDQPDSLKKAFSGLDRLLIIPSSDMRPGVRATQGREAIQRAIDAGVGHLVLIHLGLLLVCFQRLTRWSFRLPTPGYVKLRLPPRRSRGVSY
jgi:NAD(P)H dehydrogenase (quinone)